MLIPELRDLAARHPLPERFHGQLMLALVRSGQQAEALAVYQQVRRTLASELGVGPGAELCRLHERILARDASLTTAPALAATSAEAGPAAQGPVPAGVTAPGAAAGPAWEVPRQLPAAVTGFTGRAGELAALTRMQGRACAGTPGALALPAPQPGAVIEPPVGYQEATAWLDAEQEILLAAAALTAERGSRHAWQIPWLMADFLDRRGHWNVTAAILRTALAAAARLGDTVGQAVTRHRLAFACARLTRYNEACAHLTASLALCQQPPSPAPQVGAPARCQRAAWRPPRVAG